MPTLEEFFGTNAGKVWQALNSSGALTAKELAKATKLKETEVFGALGWLGREGKLVIAEEKGQKKYKLQ